MESIVQDAVMARSEGLYEDALRLLRGVFGRIRESVPGTDESYFITMFEWSQLCAEYYPAYEALVSARDEEVVYLLNGDDTFGTRAVAWPHSRFQVIVNMNETLNDTRATYELFKQLLSLQPTFAHREASFALPAIVEAEDFVLATRYLADPLPRLKELNQLAAQLPLFPPISVAPRLAAELMNFMRDVILGATVLEGLGKDAEARSLRDAALTGIASDEIRALANLEIAVPDTIMRELSSHQTRLHEASNKE
ncbi:hypothetical protein AAKU64_000098 [Undibacterium sp. GrIS 1.8]|uniref:hypothetical protein n=1 Tax=unclassified Undibacterium TaxID=2630295 RepID=UPI0033967559